MPLIKDSQIVRDPWVALDDGAPLPAGAWPIVSLERWRAEREALLGAGVPLGLRLRSDQPPAAIAEDVQHLALIALEFPKFTDGRPYSYARLLRERYGFAGELRATGQVLRDQAQFMARCGFDAFQVPEATSVEAWRAALERISVWYQPATDPRIPVPALRRGRIAARPRRPAADRSTRDPVRPVAAAPVGATESCAGAWAY